MLLLALQQAAAQPTIDGTITTGEGYALVYQNLSSNLGFGEGNRLGGLYYAYRSLPVPTMYIGITGGMNDVNNIVLFLDFDNYEGRGSETMAGTQSSSLGVFTTNSTSCGSTGGIAGARMSNGFDADYIFAFNRANSTSTIFVDAMRLGRTAINGYMEHGNINSSGLPNQTGNPHTMTLPFTTQPCTNTNGTITVAFRNDFNPVTQPTTGIEIAVPVAGLCGVAEGDLVRFFVAITNQVGFFSNVTIPALPAESLNLGCKVDLRNFTNLFTTFYLLPFQLLNLQAKAEGNRVRLHWNLLGNTAVKQLEVQHSSDGVQFASIGTISPATNERIANYNFLHRQALNGLNYYRIKAIDIRGKSAWSGVTTVSLYHKTDKLAITPNPVMSKQVRIQTGQLDRGIYSLRLLTIEGRELFRRQIFHDGLQLFWQVEPAQPLATGLYWLYITDADGSIQRQLKLVQQQ